MRFLKTFFIIFILGLVIMMAEIPTEAAETYSSLILKKGESQKIKPRLDNVIWGSSDTSVVKVNQYGKVTAKNVGDCFVTAVSSGKAEVFHVKVINSTTKAKKRGCGHFFRLSHPYSFCNLED